MQGTKEANIPVSREENFIQIYASDAGEPQNMDEIYEKSFSYTALLCASDYYAVHIENMLLDRGRKIPEEISIAGFDDVPISRIVRPAPYDSPTGHSGKRNCSSRGTIKTDRGRIRR